MNIEELIKAIPGMAKNLGEMMVNDAIPVMANMGMTFDDVAPSVSISYQTKDGEDIKVTLSIGFDDGEESDDE